MLHCIFLDADYRRVITGADPTDRSARLTLTRGDGAPLEVAGRYPWRATLDDLAHGANVLRIEVTPPNRDFTRAHRLRVFRPPPVTAMLVPAGTVQRGGESHYRFELRTSTRVAYTLDDLRDNAFTVTGGSIAQARTVHNWTGYHPYLAQERRTSDHLYLDVRPAAPNAAVSVTLLADRLCRDGGLCDKYGARVDNAPTLTMSGENTGGQIAADPLTARVAEAPTQHDGATPLTFELRFSDDVTISAEDMRDHALNLTGGTVTDAAMVDGRADRWEITVTPSGTEYMILSIPPTSSCSDAGALCAAYGFRLESLISFIVPYVPPVVPLTAEFTDVPDEHDGSSAFAFRLAFSENIRNSYRKLRDELLSATGGTVTRARRVDRRSDLWEIQVEPSGNDPVTVTLAAGQSCATAPCTADGRALSQEVTATIQGPPGLSVADAEVEEGPGAKLAFAITLDRAVSWTVTVEASTTDGTAVAGEDYRAKTLSKTFAPGETRKVAVIRVLDDSHDEGTETMTLTLSNPTGAYIADGEAVGTITNSDPMPPLCLARFGRTVADQVLDAVDARIAAPRTPGTALTLAGQRVGAGALSPEALEAREAEARVEALSDWLRGTDAEEDDERTPATRELSGRDLFTRSSFALTAGTPEGGTGAFWGRGAVSRFDGREGELTLDGEVASAMVGADFARGPTPLGLVLSHSRGEGGYRAPSGDGAVESTVTGLYPWGRHALSERLTVWGVAGYGKGEFVLTPKDRASIETDVNLAMAAVGGRGVLAKPPAEGGLELAATSDAMVVRTTSDAVRTTSDAVNGSTGSLAASEADVTRLRLGLEGTWRGLGTEGGGAFVPAVEIGVRHDGGNAETGFGVDIGAGIAWTDPARGIRAELRARGLLTHESDGFSERGFAGALAFDPDPASERGPSLTLTQTVGASATGGMDALLSPDTARALESANDDGDELRRRRLEAKLGYGFALFDGRYTGTPTLGLGLTDTRRETVLAWRLAEARRAGLVFSLDVEGARGEPAQRDAEPEHRLGFGFGWRLEGVRTGAYEVRFEGSRHEPANDDAATEHRVGVRLAARW